MTAGEILALAESVLGNRVDGLDVHDGVVTVYQSFDCFDDEPHDVASNERHDINEALETVGLTLKDTWEDNDSLGGKVVEITP
jgi:hypothetical protein